MRRVAVELTAEDARDLVPQVPVCIACDRRAVRTVRRREGRGGGGPAGIDGNAGDLFAIVMILLLLVALVGWIFVKLFGRSRPPVSLDLPVCWNHRWLMPISSTIERAGDDRIRIAKVSEPFRRALLERIERQAKPAALPEI